MNISLLLSQLFWFQTVGSGVRFGAVGSGVLSLWPGPTSQTLAGFFSRAPQATASVGWKKRLGLRGWNNAVLGQS